MISDKLLNADGLEKCCGQTPIFHSFGGFGFAIECSVNGHIHNSGLENSESAAIEAWNRRLKEKT